MKIRITVPANPEIPSQVVTLDELFKHTTIDADEYDILKSGKPVTTQTFLGDTLFTPVEDTK